MEPIETEAEQAELDEIEALNPGWHLWYGVNRILYVWRLRSSPQKLYRVRTIPGAWAVILEHERDSPFAARRPRPLALVGRPPG